MTDPVRLTGDEPFTDIDATVRDFWAYALSNLKVNAARGYLAEFLVAKAVRATGPRVEWDKFDVLAPDDTRIEVKTTGHSQAWARTAPAVLGFGGLPGGREGTKVKRSWDAETRQMIDAFVADVYVFCVQTTAEGLPYDGLDIGAWDFYVLPGRVVAGTGQKSMRLSTVTRLGGERFAWADLPAVITAVSEVNRRLEQAEGLATPSRAPHTPTAQENTMASKTSHDASGQYVDVSPTHVGHLPGCTHKDDDDYRRWGRITREGAWQDLRNGNAVAADAGARIGLVATKACKSCIARS